MILHNLKTHLKGTLDIKIFSLNLFSAAVTHQSSKCYMWGQCHGQSVVNPTETPFTSVHEVFACFASPSVTHIPMITEIHSGMNQLTL